MHAFEASSSGLARCSGTESAPLGAAQQRQFKRGGGPDLQSTEAAAAALRGFFRIAQAWGLSNDDQQHLLGCGRSSFFDWKAGRVKRGLDAATLERLSHIFGIYAGLQILLPIPERADAWIKQPNSAPLFGGGTALARMLAGQVSDLFVVRQYLDAQRGGWA